MQYAIVDYTDKNSYGLKSYRRYGQDEVRIERIVM